MSDINRLMQESSVKKDVILERTGLVAIDDAVAYWLPKVKGVVGDTKEYWTARGKELAKAAGQTFETSKDYWTDKSKEALAKAAGVTDEVVVKGKVLANAFDTKAKLNTAMEKLQSQSGVTGSIKNAAKEVWASIKDSPVARGIAAGAGVLGAGYAAKKYLARRKSRR